MAIILEDKTRTSTRQLEVRLAEDQYELEQALALRYEVFNLEMGEGLPQSRESQKDRDEYDYHCEHLIVLDKTNQNKIVGTYRILKREVARKTIGFYSENEFSLKKLYEMKDEVAEVGRSCVHKDYRGGTTISLLWIGFGQYMKENNIRYLMGCGSVHSTSAETASEVYAYLKHQNAIIREDLCIEPLPSCILPGFNPDYPIQNLRETTKKIPPLIKGYLRLGAKMSGKPALDAVFGTTDFFIFFDRNEINSRYGKHYLGQ